MTRQPLTVEELTGIMAAARADVANPFSFSKEHAAAVVRLGEELERAWDALGAKRTSAEDTEPEIKKAPDLPPPPRTLRGDSFRALVVVEPDNRRPWPVWATTLDKASGTWRWELLADWDSAIRAKFAAAFDSGDRLPLPGAYVLSGHVTDRGIEGRFRPLREFLGWLALGQDVEARHPSGRENRGVIVGGFATTYELEEGFWVVERERDGFTYCTKDFCLGLFVYLELVEEEAREHGEGT